MSAEPGWGRRASIGSRGSSVGPGNVALLQQNSGRILMDAAFQSPFSRQNSSQLKVNSPLGVNSPSAADGATHGAQQQKRFVSFSHTKSFEMDTQMFDSMLQDVIYGMDPNGVALGEDTQMVDELMSSPGPTAAAGCAPLPQTSQDASGDFIIRDAARDLVRNDHPHSHTNSSAATVADTLSLSAEPVTHEPRSQGMKRGVRFEVDDGNSHRGQSRVKTEVNMVGREQDRNPAHDPIGAQFAAAAATNSQASATSATRVVTETQQLPLQSSSHAPAQTHIQAHPHAHPVPIVGAMPQPVIGVGPAPVASFSPLSTASGSYYHQQPVQYQYVHGSIAMPGVQTAPIPMQPVPQYHPQTYAPQVYQPASVLMPAAGSAPSTLAPAPVYHHRHPHHPTPPASAAPAQPLVSHIAAAPLLPQPHQPQNEHPLAMARASGKSAHDLSSIGGGSSTWSVSVRSGSVGGGDSSIGSRRDTTASSLESYDSNGQKVRKKKSYKRTTASKFCHICLRKETAVQLAVCHNITEGTCLKVVCQICFNKHGWNWDAAVRENSEWTCTHCRGECPSTARCRVYEKVNNRREPVQKQKPTPKVVFRKIGDMPLLPSFK